MTIFLKKYCDGGISDWSVPIIVNPLNLQSMIWDCDKTMESLPKQIKKSNYNELDIES
jgi:hypothetical protein